MHFNNYYQDVNLTIEGTAERLLRGLDIARGGSFRAVTHPKSSRKLPQQVVTIFQPEVVPEMHTVRCARRIAGVVACNFAIVVGTVALCFLGTEPAHAIPSPELVVGSFVSISQLFA